MNEIVELRSLKIGDRFISASQNNKYKPIQYEVKGNPEFNLSAGTATRKCYNFHFKVLCNKQCKLKVIKLPVKTSSIL